MLAYIFLLLVSIAEAKNYSIPCETSPTSWQPGKNININGREMIVSTKYDEIDVVVDSRDGTVSRTIINGGTWEPNNIRAMGKFIK